MNSRECVKSSRRYQLRLAPPLSAELENYAAAHSLGHGTACRVLLAHGLKSLAPERQAATDSAAALASLTAAEHAVLMVASVLPEGQRRMRELASQAAQAAEERLALFRDNRP